MRLASVLALTLLVPAVAAGQVATPKSKPVVAGPNLELTAARVTYQADLDLLVFEQTVAGTAGGSLPTAAGKLDGAPVLGYVFPTTLKSEDVGFSPTDGIVALAATSHPDFDDSPYFDENSDGIYDNDGLTWHTHWVVLVKDDRVPGGLAVKEFAATDATVKLPATTPKMPMFMDSPGHSVVGRGNTLRVLVPAQRVHGKTDFRFDAVTAYMEVSTDGKAPMLGVYQVYSVLSKDLSLPFRVQ